MQMSGAGSSIGRSSAGLVTAVIVLLGLLIGASPASAHAELLSSFPGNQELLVEAPAEIALQFTESVDPIEPGIRLVDADGNEVELGALSQTAGTDRMRAAVPTTLDDGTYVVAWQAVSADSHRVRGSFTFSVGVPTAVTPGVLDGLFDGGSDTSTDSLLLGIGRFSSFAGVGLLVGGLMMALALAPTTITSRRVGLLLVFGAEVAFVGTLWMIAAQANIIGGSFLAWTDVADTRSGQWWIARLVVIALFSVLIALRSKLVVRGGTVVVSLLGLGVLGVVAAGGHAISGDAVVLGFISTLVHLAAMAIWFGGLTVVLLAPPPSQFWVTVTRFSAWALGSVVALAASGAANAWRQLGSLSGITESSYGRWLVIKLVLVGLVLAVAAFSRRTVHTRGDGAGDLVRRSVAVELAGIVLILGATAGLVNSPPPVESAEIVSVSAVVGARVAQVELEPAVTGGTEMHIYITSPSGALDRADEISVTAELPGQDIPPFDVETVPAGVNHVIGTNLNLPVAGLWMFEVTARYGEFDQVIFTVQIPVTD
jgi:copper transport protein